MNNLNSIEIDQFEYCIIEETVKLPVNSVKVSIPKLTLSTKSGKNFPITTILVNDPVCKPKSLGPVVLANHMILKTFSALEQSKSVDRVVVNHDPIRYEYYLRKGTRMIACFMNKNINDGYLTNMI